MNIPMFDQTRKNESSSYGESVRLSNELRAIQAYQFKRREYNIFGKEELKTYNIPAKRGFNCETSHYNDFVAWLNDVTIRKSQSLFWFVIRIMAIRFPEKHIDIKMSLAERHKLEFDLILSQMKTEIEWVGTVGYSQMVRLDNSLLNLNNRVIKLKNDGYKIVRI